MNSDRQGRRNQEDIVCPTMPLCGKDKDRLEAESAKNSQSKTYCIRVAPVTTLSRSASVKIPFEILSTKMLDTLERHR